MLLNLLFPRRSLLGDEGSWITETELQEIRSAVPVIVTKKELSTLGLTGLDGTLSCADFRKSPLLRKAIHLLKYKRIPDVAKVLGRLLADTFLSSVFLKERITNNELTSTFVIVPLPLHWTRKFTRGFNQSHLLANVVSTYTKIPAKNLLRRSHKTRTQVGLGRQERLQNIQNAFRFSGAFPPPATVILIDDVMTTGATLNSAAAALKQAGVATVFALTLAKE